MTGIRFNAVIELKKRQIGSKQKNRGLSFLKPLFTSLSEKQAQLHLRFSFKQKVNYLQ